MIQFEEVIIEESKIICEQLNSYNKKNCSDSGTIKLQKRSTVAIWSILLIITALTLYLFAEWMKLAFNGMK